MSRERMVARRGTTVVIARGAAGGARSGTTGAWVATAATVAYSGAAEVQDSPLVLGRTQDGTGVVASDARMYLPPGHGYTWQEGDTVTVVYRGGRTRKGTVLGPERVEDDRLPLNWLR